MSKMKKDNASDKYKLRGEEFDDVVIINSYNKQDIITALKEYASKYEIVDYKFTSSIYVTADAYYYYSVVIFYNKKGGSAEVTESPTKEPPKVAEEANEDIGEEKV